MASRTVNALTLSNCSPGGAHTPCLLPIAPQRQKAPKRARLLGRLPMIRNPGWFSFCPAPRSLSALRDFLFSCVHEGTGINCPSSKKATSTRTRARTTRAGVGGRGQCVGTYSPCFYSFCARWQARRCQPMMKWCEPHLFRLLCCCFLTAAASLCCLTVLTRTSVHVSLSVAISGP